MDREIGVKSIGLKTGSKTKQKTIGRRGQGVRPALFLCRVCLLLCPLFLLLPRSAGPQSKPSISDNTRIAALTTILDTLDLASATARTAHAVQFVQGSVRQEMAQIGTLVLPVAGVQLAPGGNVRARLRSSASSGHVSLLVTLATAPADYGKKQAYRVRLDGREVYRAIDTDPGAGVTRSVFLDVPAPKPTLDVEILAESFSEAPITITTFRIYSDTPPTSQGRGKREEGRGKREHRNAQHPTPNDCRPPPHGSRTGVAAWTGVSTGRTDDAGCLS